MRRGARFVCAAAAGLVGAAVAAGCAAAPKLPPSPPKHVRAQHAGDDRPSFNSLWRDRGGLCEDVKARGLNDLVTINVVENISGSGEAGTKTDRTSTLDARVTGFFGAPLDLNRPNLYGRGHTFDPSVSGTMENAFDGAGTTNRTGRIVGTITARVVEVMPNGNLLLESRKEITVNNEKQVLVLRGMVRPDDISASNSVPSTKVADAEIYFVGEGVVQDKQRPGWLARILDAAWPF